MRTFVTSTKLFGITSLRERVKSIGISVKEKVLLEKYITICRFVKYKRVETFWGKWKFSGFEESAPSST